MGGRDCDFGVVKAQLTKREGLYMKIACAKMHRHGSFLVLGTIRHFE